MSIGMKASPLIIVERIKSLATDTDLLPKGRLVEALSYEDRHLVLRVPLNIVKNSMIEVFGKVIKGNRADEFYITGVTHRPFDEDPEILAIEFTQFDRKLWGDLEQALSLRQSYVDILFKKIQGAE